MVQFIQPLASCQIFFAILFDTHKKEALPKFMALVEVMKPEEARKYPSIKTSFDSDLKIKACLEEEMFERKRAKFLSGPGYYLTIRRLELDRHKHTGLKETKTFHNNKSKVKWILWCLTLLNHYEITLHVSRPLLETLTGYLYLLTLSIHTETNVFIGHSNNIC